MPDVVKVVIFSVAAFVMLFIISKLLGKKQIAELNFVDYAVGISLGSIASEWATDYESPWYHYVIAMAIFFVFDIAVMLISRKAPLFKRILHGFPVVIVQHGKICYRNLKRTKLSVNDLLGMCRTAGYFTLSDVEYAIFETNGELSILPASAARQVTMGDYRPECDERVLLPAHLVVDGRVCGEILEQIGKDEDWLRQRLQVREQGVHDILLATYDSVQDTFDIHYKNELEAALETK